MSARPSHIYRFGAVSRIRPYVDDPERLPTLDILNLWKLGPGDTVISPRPRSTVLEALFFLRSPERRPAIVSVADGYIFRLNARKKCNERYGWLNQHVIGDCMIVSQPLSSLDGICDDMDAVSSMIDYEIATTETVMERPNLVLVSGNDPFFDLAPDRCVAAFTEAYHQLRAHFGPEAPIFLSAPNRKLADPVLDACEGLQGIGRIVDAGLSPDDCIFVGSPSTVMHEQFLARRPTYLLPLYADSGLERTCTEFPVLLQSSLSGDSATLRHKVPQNLSSPAKLSLEDLTGLSRNKRSPMFSPGRFFRELQPLVLANELRLLLQGYQENRR